jgi:hypothetical protein
MNKRIEQLAEQAGFFPTELTQVGPSVEKFAQLIVKECAGFRNELGVALCTDPSALHRYFGVEE